MIDLESLDTGPRSVVTQVGVIAFQMDDPDTEIRRIGEYLPAQPQMEMSQANRQLRNDSVVDATGRRGSRQTQGVGRQ
jgi:hypothetical protein